ncbi:MAG: hypothetical protein ACKOQ6_01015 [Bacteroidota bacterium]
MGSTGRHSKKREVCTESARIIPLYACSGSIDTRIREHLDCIHSLLAGLRPHEKQICLNRLFSFLLKQHLEESPEPGSYPSLDASYESLSTDDFQLIKELSGHLQQLHAVTKGN